MSVFQPLESSSFRPACELCREAGGVLVFQAAQWRVIRAEDAAFPAFYRVVWRAHVAEWSDLSLADQAALMGAVGAVERVLRDALAPAKINLASLGNVVPHLHWHVIARFDWDSRFPAPVWAPAAREIDPERIRALEGRRAELEKALAEALARVIAEPLHSGCSAASTSAA
jgi:diadenosine tetraphosphate (Ap4A) HIT family hydrolase